jgi:DnaJ-class molecular chaperone
MAGQDKQGGAADETTTMSPGDEAPPGTTGTGEAVCPDCHGTGKQASGNCPTCGGTGKVIEGIGGG